MIGTSLIAMYGSHNIYFLSNFFAFVFHFGNSINFIIPHSHTHINNNNIKHVFFLRKATQFGEVFHYANFCEGAKKKGNNRHYLYQSLIKRGDTV